MRGKAVRPPDRAIVPAEANALLAVPDHSHRPRNWRRHALMFVPVV
jgi:hypothetical protein